MWLNECDICKTDIVDRLICEECEAYLGGLRFTELTLEQKQAIAEEVEEQRRIKWDLDMPDNIRKLAGYWRHHLQPLEDEDMMIGGQDDIK